MIRRKKIWSIPVTAFCLLAGVVVGCGGDDGSTTDGSGGGGACVPGSQSACACPGGAAQGVQICQSDGSLGACDGCPGSCVAPACIGCTGCFDACVCGGKDATSCLSDCKGSGGTSGSGGTAGTGAVAGTAGASGSSGTSGFGGSSGSSGSSGFGGSSGSGASGGSSGSGGSGGGGGAACDSCVQQNCPSELSACQANPACQSCIDCVQAQGIPACIGQCAGAQEALALGQCTQSNGCPCQ